MYSETDIDAAVASGALTPAAAQALRDSVAATRQTPSVDEESFRLVTGFNDIFVAIAAILLLVAVGWIGTSLGQALSPAPIPASFGESVPLWFGSRSLASGLLVVIASWGLAEYFTKRRHMALPSILLLGSFVYGVATALFGVAVLATGGLEQPQVFAAAGVVVGSLVAGAAWLHWQRFHVPITIAALTGALVATLLSLLLALVPRAEGSLLWLLLAAGLGVFAFAMGWDMSDRTRTTRRSDVAFWLHLSYAPMIAHPVFNLLGVLRGDAGPGQAVLVLALYALFGLVALAVDRRALLVSGLLYVLIALARLFQQAGAVGLNVALTALVIGSVLLMLSAFWAVARRAVVARLPADLQTRLPALDRVQAPRPA
jgi:hypothetical protein